MKYVLSGILVGVVVVTAGVVIAEQVRRQSKIEDVADLTDRLAKQLETLEAQLAAAKQEGIEHAGSSNGRVAAANQATN
jgi:hypothetical protein